VFGSKGRNVLRIFSANEIRALLLVELEQKIADEEVKNVLLGPASLRLDQVEGFYDRKTLDAAGSEAAVEMASYRRILVTDGVRRQRLELAI
jgi:hypothetical protein